MPFGERVGWENSCSRYCGLETDFSDDVPSILTFNIGDGGFDFVLAPLTNPSYRPSLVDESDSDSHRTPFAGSELDVTSLRWKERVIGKISDWIDLDSEDETLRMDSEIALKQEVARATHLTLRACLLPTPKGTSCENYARCVKQILQGSTEIELWLRIPLQKPHGSLMRSSSGHSIWQADPWNTWNSFRLLCDHDSKLSVTLDVGNLEISLGRWLGEPVKAAIISTQGFLSDGQGDPYLSLYYQEQIEIFFRHSIQVIISGRSLKDSANITEGMQMHPYKPYWDCISSVFDRMKPYSHQERIWLGIRDYLHAPLQPLKDNLDAGRYEIYERDSVKYIQYRKAIAQALTDRVPNEKASELTTVLMVVGAGRGLLVTESLQAAEETGRMLKVYAVEKNPNAVITLHDMVKRNGWEGTVTVVSCDMRFWDAPERADILVSELLGSFGDNHLSPECLDGAQRFLKPDGISIPSSYTSFIQPITASKLYNNVKKDLSCYETAYSVNLHSVASLAPPQRVFTFTHPNLSRKPTNKCYKKLRFVVPSETGSALVQGFAGYFEAILYDKLRISTVPGKATKNMFGWLPMYFPLRNPVEVHSNDRIDASIWRCVDSKKVWYEWCVSSPTFTHIHNTNGSSYWVSL